MSWIVYNSTTLQPYQIAYSKSSAKDYQQYWQKRIRRNPARRDEKIGIMKSIQFDAWVKLNTVYSAW